MAALGAGLMAAWSFIRALFGAASAGLFGIVPLWIWPLLALGILCGVQTLRLEHAKAATAAVTADYAEYRARIAQATASANAKAVSDLQAIAAWQDAALAARNARLQAQNDALTQRLQEIADAPADQDGPVADVLRRSVERLWQ